MAKKEFRYRGMTLPQLQELSVQAFAELLPAAQRRKISRGFTEEEQTFLKKLKAKGTAKTHCRDMLILPTMVGMTVKVHNGKEFTEVIITDEMLGHTLGEFSLSRKVVRHGSAGIGSTKSGGAKKQTT